MAKARKTIGRTKTKGAAGRRRSAKAGTKRATPAAGAAAATRKLAELQAENRRLREEIASLRSELASRTGQGGEIALGEQPSLGL
jgi:cell division protein FtsB